MTFRTVLISAINNRQQTLYPNSYRNHPHNMTYPEFPGIITQKFVYVLFVSLRLNTIRPHLPNTVLEHRFQPERRPLRNRHLVQSAGGWSCEGSCKSVCIYKYAHSDSILFSHITWLACTTTSIKRDSYPRG